MPRRHVLLALSVALLWGVNFLAIHASLEQFPPMFLVALRFALIAIPTVLFVPRPNVKWRWLIGYGLGFGTAQFLFLYLGMHMGFPTGLASLVLQSSAPFTVILGALLLKEKLTARRITGVVAATTGLAVVGFAYGIHAPILPFVLVVLGGLGWAFGNLASRQAASDKPLHLVLWMSVVPPLPMLALSLLVEGPASIGAALESSLTAVAVPAWLGLAYTVVLGTLLGSGLWVWLMARYPASTVAPFSMLVPIVGISSSAVVLGQWPSLWQLGGAALVVGGVLWASTTWQLPMLTQQRAMQRKPSPELQEQSSSPAAARDAQVLDPTHPQ